MGTFKPGDTIRIRCEMHPGAFPTEYMVSFETADGPVSGFVRANNVEKISDEEGYIRATVRDVTADLLTIVAQGSFFTTTGLAFLKRDWANSHVLAA